MNPVCNFCNNTDDVALADTLTKGGVMHYYKFNIGDFDDWANDVVFDSASRDMGINQDYQWRLRALLHSEMRQR